MPLLPRVAAAVGIFSCCHEISTTPSHCVAAAAICASSASTNVRLNGTLLPSSLAKQAPNKHRKLGNGTRAKAHFSLRIEFLPFLRVHGVYGV
jgi:hypothetical protein